MGTVVFSRPARRPAPEIPGGELTVGAPPAIPPVAGSRWQQLLMTVPLLTGTIATALMFAGRDGGTYAYVVGAVFGVSTLGMLVTQWGSGAGQPRRAEMVAARRDYLRQLAVLRAEIRTTITKQRAGLLYRHPDPVSLWSLVDSFRLWERRPADGDFGVARIAVGPQTLATPLVPAQTAATADLEPMTAAALRRFLETYAVVDDLPVAVSLRGFGRIHVAGDGGRALVRAMIGQLVTLHAPDDLRVAVCAGPDTRAWWEWLKWLPHHLHPDAVDALGPVRLAAGDPVALDGVLGGLTSGRARRDPSRPPTVPQLVVVIDDAARAVGHDPLADAGLDGVTLIDLDQAPPRLPDRSTLVLRVTPDGMLATESGRTPADIAAAPSTADAGAAIVGRADALDLASAEALARRLAPLRLASPRQAGAGTVDGSGAREPDLTELLGLGDPSTLDTTRSWAPRPERQRLRVAIGVGVGGQPVELDLKESAQDGMGPHGLLIGATGSGKSELLRTIVIGLAATHPPDELNFVLVDFKGGATFATLDRLPHVAAVITNLAQELPLVDRMTDAINGEVLRRQELLRDAGRFASLRDYERARAAGASLAPLPSLLVICDEFSELLTAKPEFIELFVQIGRVGRSLGMHLLLASQRLEEGRLRGLDTHLSYRIGLRTFSSLESRTVLGVADAYELPRSPGHGYLRSGTDPLTRFRSAYVGGAYRPVATTVHDGQRVARYTSAFVPVPAAATVEEPPVDAASGRSVLDVLVGRLAGRGTPAHRVWLPPLGTAPALDELAAIAGDDADRTGALRVPVALVDRPLEQRHEVLWLELEGSAGHVAVVGGPQSGKSTALRTIVCALALARTAEHVHVYCLDFGGGQLAPLVGLPHVGGVAARLDATAVRRTVGEVASLLAERERRPAGSGRNGWPHVFLVVDGWTTLRHEYEDLEPVITDIAHRGLSYAVHVVASATRWMDFRSPVRDLFGSKVELRLGDPSDSELPRKTAARVPERSPGRGITIPDGLHMLVAEPRLTDGDLIERVAGASTGGRAPAVRLLPDTVDYPSIADDHDEGRPLALPLGLAEADLQPARVDFASEPHLLIFGDASCGKSSALRTLATTIVRRFPAERARLILVDYRRSLLGAVDTPHLIGYGTGAADTERLISSVAGYMRDRLPGPDVTPEQLRTRTWWTGPECFVLVDDYDLVVAGPGNPLLPLLDYLAQARDIGLHLVITRRSGGAGRALYDPILQRLRELDSPGLVMSGDREEGALVKSIRPSPMPAGRGWLVTRADGTRLVQLARPPEQ